MSNITNFGNFNAVRGGHLSRGLDNLLCCLYIAFAIWLYMKNDAMWVVFAGAVAWRMLTGFDEICAAIGVNENCRIEREKKLIIK